MQAALFLNLKFIESDYQEIWRWRLKIFEKGGRLQNSWCVYSLANYIRKSEYDRHLTNTQTGIKDNVCAQVRIIDNKNTFKEYVK